MTDSKGSTEREQDLDREERLANFEALARRGRFYAAGSVVVLEDRHWRTRREVDADWDY